MDKLLLFIILLPLIGSAHPGVGIVKDRKGNIYYTDLKQVWKITKGKKMVAVQGVHAHELYMDQNDNLYGEGGYYDAESKKFYHHLWVLRPNGRIDTVLGIREQYLQQDFSLAKDRKGNEYYLKRFLIPHTDTNNIYRKSPDGKETIYATGSFKNVNWLHPQDDGSLLYASNNSIYRVDTSGRINILKEQVGNSKPSFRFLGNSISIWGTWQDDAKNVYAAAFSDQAIKKINAAGEMTEIYKSKGNWAPLHGIFDNDNHLWVLEGSEQNEVRVVLVDTIPVSLQEKKPNMLTYILGGFILFSSLFIYIKFKNVSSAKPSRVKS